MSRTLVVRAGRIIDGTGRPPIVGGAILIQDERVARIGTWADLGQSAGVAVVDLGDWTVLPGLVDAHSHLAKDAMGNEEEQVMRPTARLAIESTWYARRCLASGVTSMRTLGEVRHVDVEYRKALQDKLMVGPRVLISGPPLVCSSDLGVFARAVGTADGPDEVRRTVRANLKAGADVIKVFASGGGVYSGKPEPGQPTYTREEIAAAVKTAHSFGKKVAAHAVAGRGIQNAIEAGVDTVEHGTYLTDEQAALMARQGAALVTTMTVHAYPTNFPDRVDRSAYPQLRAYSAEVEKIIGQHISHARRHGVRFALGTDSMHGLMWYEVACAVRYGKVSPMEAIVAATKISAEVCGLSENVGTLEVGKMADMIAVADDPLKDVEALSDIRCVIQAGQSHDPTRLLSELATSGAPAPVG